MKREFADVYYSPMLLLLHLHLLQLTLAVMYVVLNVLAHNAQTKT